MRRIHLSLFACAAALFLPGCEEPIATETELLVLIKSGSALSTLSIRARAFEDTPAVTDTITEVVSGKDLAAEPFRLLIRPSSRFGERFLLYVKGYADSEVVAAASNIFSFTPNQRVTVELALRPDFVDVDDDGFPACIGQLCDCNDLNPRVNPFTAERCGDFIDNNCSGLPIDEGCPCSPDAPPTPCSGLPANLRHLTGVGACYIGEVRCVDGQLETECDYGRPSLEVDGNGIDDDCDGSVDEGSSCTPGETRPCHRGFVNEAALALVRGSCRAGVQTCGSDARWGLCVGEVTPQRDPSGVGFIELPANPAAGEPGQCDGEDNDCDGLYDEEVFFDADRDGYTMCGSTVSAVPHTEPGRGPGLIDCNDDDASIHPGATELCGNTIDEDCRCDHDPSGRPVGDPGSVIGLPVTGLDGGRNCAPELAYLSCTASPRSDANALGRCGDAPEPYYRGVFSSPQSGATACYFCAATYGDRCAETLACSAKADDCDPCPDTSAPADADVAELRPPCHDAAPGACEGVVGPQWLPVGVQDPYDDCGAVSCAGYFHGIVGGRCFEKADQSAAKVVCAANGSCQSADVLCPLETSPKNTPVQGRPLCQQAMGGCSGTTEPTYGPIPSGQDPFDDCAGALTCNGAGACQKPLGETCSAAAECASGNCVDGVCCGVATCGTCQVCQAGSGACGPVTAANGVGCNGTDTFCCNGTCVNPPGTPSELGGSCGSGACAGVWSCDGSAARCEASGGAGGCWLGNGEPCTSASMCASGLCECADAACTTQRCANVDCNDACQIVNAAGTACLPVADGTDPRGACGFYWCQGGACGTHCEMNDDAKCKPEAHCDHLANPDVCVADLGPGATCVEASDCQSGVCNPPANGVCD